MAEEIRMADQEPKPVVDEPVKADATKGVRFPEDELSAIEKKFDDDKLKADETARAAGAVEPAPEVDEDASVAKLSELLRKWQGSRRFSGTLRDRAAFSRKAFRADRWRPSMMTSSSLTTRFRW
jgi:hypothetical protein